MFPQLTFDDGTLCWKNTPADSLPFSTQRFWKWDNRGGYWRCDALHYREILSTAERMELRFEDNVPAWQSIHWTAKPTLAPLRPYQKEAISAWNETHRGLIILPTGSGKTEVALTLLHQLACSTLVVSPVRALMYQWHQRIQTALNYDAGVIGDNLFDVRPISVTTYDSAFAHMPKLGNLFQLIIFDECHHLPGPLRSDAARMSAAPFRLGLTATPERFDGKEKFFPQLIGPICYERTLVDSRGEELADYAIVKLSVKLTEEEEKRHRELGRIIQEYVVEQLENDPSFKWVEHHVEEGSSPRARKVHRALRERQSIEETAENKLEALEDIFRLHPEWTIIVFAGSNVMARLVSARFLIPCLLEHCGKKERADILQKMRDGHYRALVANQVLDEGVDLPIAKIAVVIGGKSSTRQAKQRLGRILRKVGKAKAILYEVVCKTSGDEKKSRLRRKTDAYQGPSHRQL